MYRDSTLIMQLLRDNLTLWTSDMNEAGKLSRSSLSFSSLHLGADKKEDAEEAKEEAAAPAAA
jgi:14-3-3 protein epsilon